MIIKNGLIFQEDGRFIKGELYIDRNHKIAAEPEAGEQEVIDAEGLYVIPGLIDIHTHGAVMYDFSDANANGLAQIAAYEKSCGVTTFCPTSMTLPEEELVNIFASINDVPQSENFARIGGINMEGPFLSRAKKGAHVGEYLIPANIKLFQNLNEICGGRIKFVTIAPELVGSANFIEKMKGEVGISIGHSGASYKLADRAFQAGARHVTHLFNAMPPLHHRDPGVIGAAYANPHVMVEVIADGIHIHPTVVRMIFEIFGDDRVILISDSMRATGLEDGVYELGGQEVFKKGNSATLADGTLAGSVTNLFECMKRAVSFGVPFASAVKAASCNPAKSIREDSIGSLSVGKEADVLLLDSDLKLIKVI